MKRRRSGRRGAALIYAMAVVLVVSASASALQMRTANLIRRSRLDRERAAARLAAESRVETERGRIRREGRPGPRTWDFEARERGVRVVVTLRAEPGRLPAIVRWSE